MNRKAFDTSWGVVYVVMIIFGIVGNIISFLTWTRGRRCKNSPGKFFLIALAISDTVALVLPGPELTLELWYGKKTRDLGPFFCKLERYTLHLGLIISTWIVVCFTVERAIVVSFPMRSMKWVSKRRSAVIIFIIVVVNLLINFPYLSGSKMLTEKQNTTTASFSNTGRNDTSVISTGIQNNITDRIENNVNGLSEYCGLEPSSFIAIYQTEYHFWFLDFILWFSVPLSIIAIANLMILVSLFKRHRAPRRETKTDRKKGVEYGMNSMTKRAVALGVVHFISTGTFSIAVLIPGFYEKAFVQQLDHYYYVGVVLIFTAYINHGANFILYSFFGTAFKRDCVELVCGRTKLAHSSSATENTLENGRLSVTELSTISGSGTNV